jgi:hypothetical protein
MPRNVQHNKSFCSSLDATYTIWPLNKLACCVSIWGLTLVLASTARTQNEGLGTLSELVEETLDTQPTPEPTPAPPPNLYGFAEAKGTTSAEAQKKQFFTGPTSGFEFDYRFKQQKTGLLIGTNSYEMRPSFGITAGGFAELTLEYYHIWTDGSNDVGLKQTGEQNGLKPTVEVKLSDEVTLSVPFAFGENDIDTHSAMATTRTRTQSFATNPLVVLSKAWKTSKRHGDKKRTLLKLSLVPAWRLGVTDKEFTNVDLPNIHGWTGTASLLGRAEYGITDELTINGSITYSRLTHFHSSDGAPRPDPNTVTLATGVKYKPLFLNKPKRNGEPPQPLLLALSYQYDGFNRDAYQHTVSIRATYEF